MRSAAACQDWQLDTPQSRLAPCQLPYCRGAMNCCAPLVPPLQGAAGAQRRLGARKGAPPGAESSDRSGWAGTCLCTNEVQGKGLVPTRVPQVCNCSV